MDLTSNPAFKIYVRGMDGAFVDRAYAYVKQANHANFDEGRCIGTINKSSKAYSVTSYEGDKATWDFEAPINLFEVDGNDKTGGVGNGVQIII